MSKASRVEIDSRGTIVRVDAAFCAMMRDTPDRLVGTHMLILTAPADHAKCLALFTRLVEEGLSFGTVKRLIRRDMSHVWIFNRAEEIEAEDGERRFALAIRESAPPVPRRDPGKLRDVARSMLEIRRQRTAIFNSGIFTDHAWDMLSLAYIAEAEGTVLTIADVQAEIGMSSTSITRWIRALGAEELVEYEGGHLARGGAAIRLSAVGHRKFEKYLCQLAGSFSSDEGVLID